jgi:hypothetical protein
MCTAVKTAAGADKCAGAGDGSADDQRVDLPGALVGVDRLGVSDGNGPPGSWAGRRCRQARLAGVGLRRPFWRDRGAAHRAYAQVVDQPVAAARRASPTPWRLSPQTGPPAERRSPGQRISHPFPAARGHAQAPGATPSPHRHWPWPDRPTRRPGRQTLDALSFARICLTTT